MRFVDASVFLHAYMIPRRTLPPDIETLKRRARGIVKRISEGEEVATSLVHISEVSWKRLETLEGILKEGDRVKVKLIGTDPKSGKFKLSRKVLLPKPERQDKPQDKPAGS